MELTSRTLLDLCNFNSAGSTQSDRLDILNRWHKENSELLASLIFDEKKCIDKRTGCHPLHWACGTGLDGVISFLLDHYTEEYRKWTITNNKTNHTSQDATSLVNQWAIKPSTGRTPLHYASRNGHLSTCRLLIEKYQADPNPKCHRGSVTPLQLAVWQNQLNIVQYLVATKNHITDDNTNTNTPKQSVALETNDFNCGLNHWIGLIPKHRWLSEDGSGVLPLARYLHDQGVSYTSNPNNQQNQGHTPLHKAAWGGNIALIEYYHKDHDVYDNLQDACGNYAADLAAMGGHLEAQKWLQHHASCSREESCQVLGVPVTATNEEIQTRYKALARKCHPDKLQSSQTIAGQTENNDKDSNQEFLRIKASYEHLIHQGGAGNQRNPKYEALKLITAAKLSERKEKANANNTQGEDDDNDIAKGEDTNREQNILNHSSDGDDDDLFHARILAIISDYGDKGFPISAISKRWNQVWPDRPFPSPENYIIEVPAITKTGDNDAEGKPALKTNMVQKRVPLLKFLKWKCRSVVTFRKVNGVELAFEKTKMPSPKSILVGSSDKVGTK